MSRRFAVLVLSTLLVAGVAMVSRGASALDLTQATAAACKPVGWIAQVHKASPRAALRLSGPPKGCAYPGGYSKVAKDQRLFANETMLSGGGRITFKSVVPGVPNLTCIVASKSRNVIYPELPTRPNARAVLKIVDGATSCQVEQGKYTNAKSAVFVVNGTKLEVHPRKDPVFGIKAVGEGSLIQVKKGTVRVGSKAVAEDQQVVDSGTSVGAATPLKLDPILRPGLCALTPELRLTDVKTASGARPGGNPIGLAPDRFGYLWFTDDAAPPAIGRYNMATGEITYPNGGGLGPDSVPVFIIADTTGMIWFTDAGPTPAIGKIDPTTTKIVEYGLPPGSVPWNPAYDPVHKLVWFTDHRPNGAIGSLDPGTGKVTEYTQGLNPGSHPQGLVVDRRGNVWFTDDNDPRPAIGVLDGKTHVITEYETGLVEDSLPRGIAIDPRGRVWFADEKTIDNSKPNSLGDGLIGMIDTNDPKHTIVEYAVFSNGGNLHSIPEGLVWYRGFVWFTDDGATKAIGRIDPTTGAVTESSKNLVADSKPIGIVVAKGSLWFTDRLQSAPKIGKLTAKPSC